ncbi:MAG: MmcQ/YjbR family DNA-binding protein [Bacteroidota bacterium]|nr:MmcQ/YjbR family DNA-binding protein [Bacteroidota bacterium]
MVDIETFTELALSFPGAIELPHFEKTSFRVNKKIFATLDIKLHRACLMLSEIDQSVFSAIDKTVIYPVPNKWGKQGATYVELKMVNKNILKDALNQAYTKIGFKNLNTKSNGKPKKTK